MPLPHLNPSHVEAHALTSLLSNVARLLSDHRTPESIRHQAEIQARNLINGIGSYYRLGMPFGETALAFAVWFLHGQYTSAN